MLVYQAGFDICTISVHREKFSHLNIAMDQCWPKTRAYRNSNLASFRKYNKIITNGGDGGADVVNDDGKLDH